MAGSARASNYFDETSELANACRVESYAIGAEMKKVGLPDNLIVAAVTTANDFEGYSIFLRCGPMNRILQNGMRSFLTSKS
jgi:hypothetical protein